MSFDPAKPYNALPLLPPQTDLEPKAVLKSCVMARCALAELKQIGALIPNQAILINSIPMLEAQASSAIEHIITTTDRLFQFASGNADQRRADPATKEALRYRTALYQGFQSLARRPLCTATAVEVCRTIKGSELDIRRTPGTALINDATGSTIYTPPQDTRRKADS